MSSKPRSAAAFARVEWIPAGHPERADVERFVRLVYRARFGARLGAPMPRLLAFRSADGALEAALGLRCASEGPLFVERYLGEPVEQRLAGLQAGVVERTAIVELGNLAARTPGAARAVILAMLPLLQQAGLRWALFVATRQLRNTCARLGLAPVRLQSADPARLQDEAKRWGRYYESRPDVVAGDLHALPALRAEYAAGWLPCARAS